MWAIGKRMRRETTGPGQHAAVRVHGVGGVSKIVNLLRLAASICALKTRLYYLHHLVHANQAATGARVPRRSERQTSALDFKGTCQRSESVLAQSKATLRKLGVQV
jgi:hypothetical protein